VPPNTQPVPCKLGFKVFAHDRIVSIVNVESLQYDGSVGADHMNRYSAGTISIPIRGKYTLELTNGSENLLFQSANFSLERKENAANAAFAAGISKIFSCFLLVLSAVVGTFSWVCDICWKRKQSSR